MERARGPSKQAGIRGLTPFWMLLGGVWARRAVAPPWPQLPLLGVGSEWLRSQVRVVTCAWAHVGCVHC